MEYVVAITVMSVIANPVYNVQSYPLLLEYWKMVSVCYPRDLSLLSPIMFVSDVALQRLLQMPLTAVRIEWKSCLVSR